MCSIASLVLFILLVGPGHARSQDRDDEIALLKSRLARLEEQLPVREEAATVPAELKVSEPAPKVPEAIGQNTKMDGKWRNGLQFETADKAFRWSVGGVLQLDSTFFGSNRGTVRSVGAFNNLVDPGLALPDGFSFRRARLRFAGTMWEQVEFFAQYEFAQSLDLRRRTLGISPTPTTAPTNDFDPGDDVGFNEVYLGVTELPVVGTVRVGRHRESLNFVTATADNNQVWLERGLMFDAFNGDFNFSNGVTVSNNWLDGRAYGLLGFFHANNNSNRGFYAVGDGEYAYDARLTGLPVYDEDDKTWVHLGADYSYRNPHGYQLRYRARPDVRSGPSFLTPNILSTGTIFTRDAQQIVNLEFAAARGRFTFAAEVSTSWVTDATTGGPRSPDGSLPAGAVARGTYRTGGGYVEALAFLTRDHRKYVKDRPGYARVIPEQVFYFMDGKAGRILTSGAWEVGARYEYLDLTDAGINGGAGRAASACVNWYLNPNARIQANYTWMDRRFFPSNTAALANGSIHAFGMRFNVDF